MSLKLNQTVSPLQGTSTCSGWVASSPWHTRLGPGLCRQREPKENSCCPVVGHGLGHCIPGHMFSPCLNKDLALQAAPRNSWHFRNQPRIFSTLLISLLCSRVCLNPILPLWISLGWGLIRGWQHDEHTSHTCAQAVSLAQESRMFPIPRAAQMWWQNNPNISDIVTRESKEISVRRAAARAWTSWPLWTRGVCICLPFMEISVCSLTHLSTSPQR